MNINQNVGAAAEKADVEVSPVERESTEMRSEGGDRSSLRSILQGKLNAQSDSETPAAEGTSNGKVQGLATAAPQKQTSTTQAAPSAKASDSGPILPPADMDPAKKAIFDKLPADMQEFISKRAYETRADYTRKTMELGQKAREVSDLLEIKNTHGEYFEKKGVPMADAVRRAVAWEKAFERDRIGAALEYLEAQGVHVTELSERVEQNPNAQAEPKYLTPEEAKSLAEREVQRALSEKDGQVLAARNANELKSFLESNPLMKDPGTASQLEEAMTPIVKALKQQSPTSSAKELLDRAYAIVTSDPALPFSVLVSKLNAKVEAEKRSAEALKAKASSRSIYGGPGQGTPKINASSLRENLRLRYNGQA